MLEAVAPSCLSISPWRATGTPFMCILCICPNVFVYISKCVCVCVQMFLCIFPNISVYVSKCVYVFVQMLPLGSFWLPLGCLGLPLAPFGCLWDPFGVPLGSLWHPLGCPWAPLGCPWAPSGCPWTPLGCPWAPWRCPWAPFGSLGVSWGARLIFSEFGHHFPSKCCSSTAQGDKIKPPGICPPRPPRPTRPTSPPKRCQEPPPQPHIHTRRGLG